MICAIGCDLVQNSRVKTLLERYGERFLRKVTTDRFISVNEYKRVSGMWAVREAAFKACYQIETAKAKWSSIRVTHDGKMPIIRLNGSSIKVQSSVSHDGEYTMAVCLLIQ